MDYFNKRYIWQQDDWPAWRYNLERLSPLLAKVNHINGLLEGRMVGVGISLRAQANLSILTEDVLKTSEIEGEFFSKEMVRSSIAQRLGIDVGALAPVDRNVDGVVEMVLDATCNYSQALTKERLLGWHAGLFPTGYSGMSKIKVGDFRDDSKGSMQVVSGPIGRQKVHFEAPPAMDLQKHIDQFLNWANHSGSDLSLIKAGLAHLWFVTLHPFDDGNGRIARAVGDLFLARADQRSERFYSLSAQIQKERKSYYEILEHTQKSSLDVTPWLSWFLQTTVEAIESANASLEDVLLQTKLWRHWSAFQMNPRQHKIIKRLLDGFEGKLTTQKWAIIGKCSHDTALRDINDLIEQGILIKTTSGGRSTSYEIRPIE
jgi:Fic family protein